ncbi:transcriptional antiterminator [Halobacteroides halobius DSM 5150]|uniref:Transcriptional antiterminator n=1 Tax=Halobacteroides halobius (strain ATCC 35273 / DSM 5150 / MD-1) TaxID=748449 RepID=L0K9P7_HALHC|nr:BglG family transcription antiterminator [Halobacteroides halobius]AGB42027.1 transcriptional antiterminator [Halobacteroides halobius DSM 5150]
MSLKPRVCQLLKYLINQEKAVSIKQLADKFNVSSRTIRYDLDDIESSISSYDAELIRKRRVGVYLEGEEEELNKIQNELVDIHGLERVLSPKERQHLILFRLFQANEPIIIKELEVMLRISKSTIIKDLDKVEEWLSNHNLTLIRKTNYGLEIKGEEIDIRHAMMNVLEETANEKELVGLLRQIQKKALENRNLEPGFFKEFDKLVSDIDLTKIESVISFAEKQLGFQFADEAYASLLVHLALAISRLLEGKDIQLPKERLEIIKKSDEYKIAKKIGKIMEQIFEISIPDSELGYVTLHLMGAKLWQKIGDDDYEKLVDEDLDQELIILTKEMVKVAEDYLGVKLIDDTQLIIGLALHLKPTINRIKYDLPLKNPLLLDVKSKYREIFKAAKRATKILQSKFQKEISSDEVGYITLHLGAALERSKSLQSSRKLRVVLVCSSGVGTTNLLSSRLNKEFSEIKICDVFSVIQLENNEVDLENIDLIITTIPLDIDDVLVLQVNPLLSQEDKKNIKAIIHSKQDVFDAIEANENSQLQRDYSFAIEEVIEVIEREAIVGDKEGLKKDLKDFFASKEVKVLDKVDDTADTQSIEESGTGLLELLTANNVAVIDKIDNWRTGVKVAGKPLVDQGHILEEYVDRTIEIVEEKGAYVVIAPHISLIHARPEDGVVNKSMGLGVIKEGVNFGHDYDPVHLIFTLAPIDEVSHLSALSELLKLIDEYDFVEKMLTVDRPKDVITKIEEMLN